MKRFKIADKLTLYLNKLFYNKEIFQRDSFDAIADLLIYSIRQQDETIQHEISDFMYQAFNNWRKSFPNEPYRIEYYNMLFNTMSELVVVKNNRLKLIENRISGLNWLLGEYSDTEIHEETYKWLWVILKIPIEYGNDKMLMNYWGDAYQYFRFSLQKIYPDYSNDDRRVINQEDIDKRNKERDRFLEFHYVLGGLLMFSERYNCIARIFDYTMSEPPDYVLLPKTMNDVFEWLFRFRSPYDNRLFFISDLYGFPDFESTNSDSKIRGWISKYFALLFIRQFTLYHYLFDPIKKPHLPETQREKKLWLDYLDYFEKLVSDILNDDILLNKVGFGYINSKWFEDNKNIRPLNFLKELKQELEKSFKETVETQGVSNSKFELYKKTTNEILTKTFSAYSFLDNKSISGTAFNNYYPIIRKQLLEKAAFANSQEVDYSNFDSFHAEGVSVDFKRFISDIFYINKTESYLIDEEVIFDAIDRLQVNEKDFILIGFNLNINYYIQTRKIKDLSSTKYKQIEIINIGFSTNRTNNSVLILRKDELPYLDFSDISQEEKTKYELKSIGEKYKIYANVINLNEREDVSKEILVTNPNEDLKKSVLSVILYRATLMWKKNIKCVQIQAYSKYYQQGLPNSLDDIKKF